MTAAAPLLYRIRIADPHAHLFAVSATVVQPDPSGQRFALPAWIPGSYMVRDFARHIVSIRAHANGKPVALTQLDKQTWSAAPCAGPLTVEYDVYAWDLSVRAAHLDATHGFFNGSSVFLRALGHDATRCLVEIVKPQGAAYADWRVATTLREASAPGSRRASTISTKRHAFGWYEADDYDELIDHPVELGTFVSATFSVHGVEHEIAVTGQLPALDLARIVADLKPVCAAQAQLFAGAGKPRLPLARGQRYLFLVTATGNGYGGLEHRSSTALICARSDLPVIGRNAMTDGYRTFLGLCSHEYFHSWHIKRIKPAAFVDYDLDREQYTRLLWVFEGFTSYYDDLMLVRAGVIGADDYLALVQKNLNQLLRGNGRTKQSVVDSSLTAWTKYYKQDENAPNAIVSYYAKGALIALALDLKIRAATAGERSLDDLMRLLWQRFGRHWYQRAGARGPGVAEDAMPALIAEAANAGPAFARWLRTFFADCIDGTADVSLAALWPQFGVDAQRESDAGKPTLGVRTRNEGGWLKLTHLLDGGTAQAAGLAAGDLLVALGGLRVTPDNLEALLQQFAPGQTVEALVFRDDRQLTLTVTPRPAHDEQWTLKVAARPAAAAKRLRAGWLGGR